MSSASSSRAFRSRTNSLGISQAVLDALIDRLEASAQGAPAARAAMRVPFRRLALPMAVFHSDGSRAGLQVACRNISSGGIGILHSAYMHVGIPCEVTLPRAGLSAVTVPGRVVRCRHVGGKVHEIGIQFRKPIEPREFAVPNEQDVRRILEAVNPSEFSAKVLFRVTDDALRRQVCRAMESTKATVQIVGDQKPPVRPDVLLCELPPAGANVAETLLQLAEVGMTAPVVMIVPSKEPAVIARLKEYSPDGSIFLPVETLGLCRSLVEAMLFSSR